MKSNYDFKETEAFMDDNIPLPDLYEDVCHALHLVSTPTRYINEEARTELWRILITCADFLDTIGLR